MTYATVPHTQQAANSDQQDKPADHCRRRGYAPMQQRLQRKRRKRQASCHPGDFWVLMMFVHQ